MGSLCFDALLVVFKVLILGGFFFDKEIDIKQDYEFTQGAKTVPSNRGK